MRRSEGESQRAGNWFSKVVLWHNATNQLMVEVGVGWMDGGKKQLKVNEMAVDCRIRKDVKRLCMVFWIHSNRLNSGCSRFE